MKALSVRSKKLKKLCWDWNYKLDGGKKGGEVRSVGRSNAMLAKPYPRPWRRVRAIVGVWFAVDNSVALACCNIWFWINLLLSLPTLVSRFVDRAEVNVSILTSIWSSILNKRFCTAPNFVCFSFNIFANSVIAFKVSSFCIPCLSNLKSNLKFVSA